MSTEKPKAGPMPTGRRHKNVPVPFFFQPDTADTFATLEPVADDVFLASMPKGGTTWTHKIIHLLLHGLDDDGQPVPEAASSIGAKGQVYPEALPLEPVTDSCRYCWIVDGGLMTTPNPISSAEIALNLTNAVLSPPERRLEETVLLARDQMAINGMGGLCGEGE